MRDYAIVFEAGFYIAAYCAVVWFLEVVGRVIVWIASKKIREPDDENPRCAECGYSIVPCSSPVCPECGSNLFKCGLVMRFVKRPAYPIGRIIVTAGIWFAAVIPVIFHAAARWSLISDDNALIHAIPITAIIMLWRCVWAIHPPHHKAIHQWRDLCRNTLRNMQIHEPATPDH